MTKTTSNCLHPVKISAMLALAAMLAACADRTEPVPQGDPQAAHAGHEMAMPMAPAAVPQGAAQWPIDAPLVDIGGVSHGTLAAPREGNWTGLIFVRTDCPVSNQYSPEIKRICSEYAPQGLQCLLVYADPYDSAEAVRKHHAEFGYELPAILDHDHALVARAGANITPEVALFAHGAEQVYTGRIDNLYNELGRPRQQVTERDLRNALDDLVAGRQVRTPRSPATGCFIE